MTVKIEDLKAIKILENGISLMEDSKKDNPEMIVFLENEVNLYHKAIEELCDIFKEFEDREMLLSLKDICNKDCKHFLSENGNFPLSCGECSRFYADMFESKDNEHQS